MANKTLPVVGFVAPSGTGKTTLLRKLVPVLRERGLRIGYLKHTHHDPDLDTAGKDSDELARAGAAQVMLASPSGWALLDHRAAAVEDPYVSAAQFDADGLDLLLVEGFHRARYPKIEVYRSASGKPPMYPADADIVAVVADTPLPGDEHPPELPIEDPEAVADFIVERLGDGRFAGEDPRDQLLRYGRRLRVDGCGDVRAGNVSLRVGRRFWITPDGGGELGRGDLIVCPIEADLPEDASLAVAMHRQVYLQQPEARAVLHARAPFSVAVSFGGRDFQPIDFDGARRLGSVPVLSVDAEKAPAKLGETLASFPLCMLAGHGAFAWGNDLEQACGWTELLEYSAKVYVISRQAAAL